MKLMKSAAAVALGASLVLTAAACSQETKDKAASAASDVTDAAAAAASDAKSKASEVASDAKSAASDATEAAASAATDAKAAAGDVDALKAKLPANIKSAWEAEGAETGMYGQITDIKEKDGATAAYFEHGAIVESAEHGVVPVVGMIGQTWIQDGGVDSKVGLPVAVEQGDKTVGWTQDFANGTITWGPETGTADFKALVTVN